MKAEWKPAILVWRWEDAPEEFKHLGGFEGPGESVVYIPALLAENDDYWASCRSLEFLEFFPKSSPDAWEFTGNGWGWYSLHRLPDGSRVALTRDDGDID